MRDGLFGVDVAVLCLCYCVACHVTHAGYVMNVFVYVCVLVMMIGDKY